jgi:hypothetical protein
MDSPLIRGERLTTWAATPDGERVELGVENDAGRPCTISLPVALLSALMMTIPRMLRHALQARFGNGSMRLIHELGTGASSGPRRPTPRSSASPRPTGSR